MVYLTQACSFVLQTLSWLSMCFQQLTCFVVKLTTRQEWQIFCYLVFIAFLIVCSVTTACKLAGGRAGRVKGKAGYPLLRRCGVGAPGPAINMVVRATARCFRVGSPPSFLVGVSPRSSLPHDPTRTLNSPPGDSVNAFKRLRFPKGLSRLRK